MKTEIIVAIIAAAGAIIVAIINKIGKQQKSDTGTKSKDIKDIEVNQQSTGKGNTMIGVQITKKGDEIDG